MKTINVIEAKKMINEKLGKSDFELIDVRSPMEYKSGHIKGSRLIPLEELGSYDEFDKEKTYLLYCRSGGRSAFAQQLFLSKGLKAINMMGGMIDWSEEGFEIEN